MALRILSSRQLIANLSSKVCITSGASMSSAPTKKGVKKSESMRSWLASFTGGKMDPANEGAEPIDANEVMLSHKVDHATGEEKLLLLAFENGILDPYCNQPVERNGRGTKDNPIKIESFLDERMVACVCEPAMNYMKFTQVYRGEPKRCACGHWMELVPAPKFWRSIPKEDLLEIPYFRDLDEDGILDKMLAGQLSEAEEKEAMGIVEH